MPKTALKAPQNAFYSISEWVRFISAEYGISQGKLEELIHCESSGREDVKGDEGRAYGLLQFHRQTFEIFSEKYNKNFDYFNSFNQIELAALMLRDGKKQHWAYCAKAVKL